MTASELAVTFAHRLGHLLFPPTCPGCKRMVARQGALCGKCWNKLRFFEKPWCDVMGTPFAYDHGETMLSAEAIANPPPFTRARAVLAYDGLARSMVSHLKYRDGTHLAPEMATWMIRVARDVISSGSIVVPIPLHPARLLFRRFNQAAELGRAFAKQANLRFRPAALIRRKNTKKQVGLGARERARNVSGAFIVPPEQTIEIRGRSVILIDDVYTTGATVYAAARALNKAGAGEINVVTFARVLTLQ